MARRAGVSRLAQVRSRRGMGSVSAGVSEGAVSSVVSGAGGVVSVFGWKLFVDAQAFTSVPSTEKCSSDSSGATETVQNFVPWRISLRHWEAVFEHDCELTFDCVPFAH